MIHLCTIFQVLAVLFLCFSCFNFSFFCCGLLVALVLWPTPQHKSRVEAAMLRMCVMVIVSKGLLPGYGSLNMNSYTV